MLYRLTRIYPKSLAKFQGLIMGSLMTLFALPVGLVSALSGNGILAGLLMIIVLPVLYGLFGYITGFVTAWILNFFAGKVGGLELELEQGLPLSKVQKSGQTLPPKS